MEADLKIMRSGLGTHDDFNKGNFFRVSHISNMGEGASYEVFPKVVF